MTGNLDDLARINGNTVLCGVIGYPIGHSLSPVMHNAAFRSLGINWCYLPFEVEAENLETALKSFPSLGIRGINVTIPHKEAVIPFLDEVTEGAATVGSVNTIEVASSRLKGYNTDVIGFAGTLEAFKGSIGKAAIIGAGGAARAVLFALLDRLEIKHFTLLNRTDDLDQARTLVSDFSAVIAKKDAVTEIVDTKSSDMGRVLKETDLLVNCTPLGMPPLRGLCPVPRAEWLHPDMIVYDLVYNPARTPLFDMSESQGATAVNGVDMLVGQGAAAFSLWTGREAPEDVMKEALLSALESAEE